MPALLHYLEPLVKCMLFVMGSYYDAAQNAAVLVSAPIVPVLDRSAVTESLVNWRCLL